MLHDFLEQILYSQPYHLIFLKLKIYYLNNIIETKENTKQKFLSLLNKNLKKNNFLYYIFKAWLFLSSPFSSNLFSLKFTNKLKVKLSCFKIIPNKNKLIKISQSSSIFKSVIVNKENISKVKIFHYLQKKTVLNIYLFNN